MLSQQIADKAKSFENKTVQIKYVGMKAVIGFVRNGVVWMLDAVADKPEVSQHLNVTQPQVLFSLQRVGEDLKLESIEAYNAGINGQLLNALHASIDARLKAKPDVNKHYARLAVSSFEVV